MSPSWTWRSEQPERAQGPTVKRWGLRLLASLGLAFVVVLLSSAQGAYSIATLLLLIVALGGASWCSVRGLKAMYDVPPDRRAQGRPQDRDPA